MNNNKFTVRDMAELSIVAALYVVLTLAFTPLSYGDVQFRISEALMLLVVYKRKYAISLVLGCLVSNIFSPVGWVDIIFGTLATLIACIPMMFIKRLEISSIFPSVSNGLIVGLELALVYELPIFLTMTQVFIGEFVVVSLIGIPLFKSLEKNKGFMEAIGAEPLEHGTNWLNPYISFSIALNVLTVLCFFKLSIKVLGTGEDTVYDTLFNQAKVEGKYYGIVLILISLMSLLSVILLEHKLGLIFDIVLQIIFVSMFIFISVSYSGAPIWSFYIYLIIPMLFAVIAIVRYINNKKEKVIGEEENI